MSLLKTSNLTIGFPPDKVLMEAVNVELQQGKLIGIIGQNGVGKSTFIRTICGLHAPLNGEILLNNQAIQSYNQKEIAKKIALVLTTKPSSLNLSVLELVSLGRHPHSNWLGLLNGEDKDRIDDAITKMEINYIATKKLFELSDGQLQKTMIARALAQDTDLIILDEPTSHLDLKNKIEVLELLKKIAEDGKGILMSTHEIQLSSQVCTEYWCFDFGRSMASGNALDLIKDHTIHEYLHLPKKNQVVIEIKRGPFGPLFGWDNRNLT